MKFILFLGSCLLFALSCRAQDTSRIYHFMNEELPPLELGKSDWSIFFSDRPYLFDAAYCNYLQDEEWNTLPPAVREDFCRQFAAIDTAKEARFR